MYIKTFLAKTRIIHIMSFNMLYLIFFIFLASFLKKIQLKHFEKLLSFRNISFLKPQFV